MERSIGIIGTGYVGLVHAAVMAEYGYRIIAMDSDREKVNNLNMGIMPIYEPGLQELVDRNVKAGRIEFTDNIQYTVESSSIVFIAVGTPQQEDGSADLHYVKMVASQIGQYINKYMLIINKSTVPVGTGTKVESVIKDELEQRQIDIPFDVVSNPEFLREGKAVHDSIQPDRIVVGTTSLKAENIMREIYEPFQKKGVSIVYTSRATAEMIKYASNAFLAVKISFINEMALLAEKVGADIKQIANAMGQDSRISSEFLEAGPGYGGSCFPKDTRAIVEIAKGNEEELMVVEAAIKANRKQVLKVVEKISKVVNPPKEAEKKTIGIWGLSFKPETDDMRESPALYIIEKLIKEGFDIRAYCPKGIPEAKWRLEKYKDAITYCEDEYCAVKDVNALVVITDWKQFSNADFKTLAFLMKKPILFDLRNMFYGKKDIQDLFEYHGLGC